MKIMSISELRAHLSTVVDDVDDACEPILITRHNRPVAKLVRADSATPDDVFGCLRGLLKIVGDVEGPAEAVEHWECLR